jgi:hypothetical protein
MRRRGVIMAETDDILIHTNIKIHLNPSRRGMHHRTFDFGTQ